MPDVFPWHKGHWWMCSCLGIQAWTSIKELGGLILVLTTGILQYTRGGKGEEDLALTYSVCLVPHNRPAATRCSYFYQLSIHQDLYEDECPPDTFGHCKPPQPHAEPGHRPYSPILDANEGLSMLSTLKSTCATVLPRMHCCSVPHITYISIIKGF